MARILYGVAGEGMGHAVRSRVIIKELIKNNEVKILTASRAYSYLKRFFDTEKIGYFKIIYWNNNLLRLLSFFVNIARFPSVLAKSWKISQIIKEFNPDVMITDFEPMTAYFAYFKKIPLISVDNQHILSWIDYKNIPKKYWLDMLAMKLITKLFVPKANKRFIFSFFHFETKREDNIIINPLIRKKILDAEPATKGHILVYQSSKTNKKLIKELQKIDDKFIVYGLYENKSLGNVTLKDFNESKFYKDLLSCYAVITNGGFSLISEAIYLGKPILSIPIKGQFEQILNGIYVEKLGYGAFSERTSKEAIESFIKNIPMHRKNLINYKKHDNKEALSKINEAVDTYSVEFNIKS